MAKVTEIYAVKNDEPETLTIFIGYVVHKDTLIAQPIRVVQRDKNSVINLNTGAVLIVGTGFFYDPLQAIDLMVAERKKQISAIEFALSELEEFRKRVTKAKEVEKKNAK